MNNLQKSVFLTVALCLSGCAIQKEAALSAENDPALLDSQTNVSTAQTDNDPAVLDLQTQVSTAQTEIEKREEVLKEISDLLQTSKEQSQAELSETSERLAALQKSYDDLTRQMQDQQKQYEIALANSKSTIDKLEKALSESESSNKTEPSAQIDTTVQTAALDKAMSEQAALKDELEALTKEINILRKANQDEKKRADTAIIALNQLIEQSNTQISALQKHSENSPQGQTQELLNLQQQAQRAEISAKKLQDELKLAQGRTTQLETTLEDVQAQLTKQNQEYHLKLAELQQKLLNSRRAEQEAQRWARTTGSGNSAAFNDRIVNLQQEVDRVSANEKMQRELVAKKDQELLNLEAELKLLREKSASKN